MTAPQADAVALPDGRQMRDGTTDGVYVVADPDGPVVAAFYALDGEPGWWRGHAFGRVKQVFAPDVEPPEVARRFLAR